MRKASCPSCKQTIQLEEGIKVQALVSCPECKSYLELVSNFPPTLALIEDLTHYSSQGKLTKYISSKPPRRYLMDVEKSTL